MASFRCLIGRHRRSGKHRFRDQDGLMKTECARCGVRMVRPHGTRRWVAHSHRDLRRQLAPVRAFADRMTGPVLFLVVMAGLLGVALWIGGVSPK